MKPKILLLNGWGSTCGVWEPIIPALEDRYQINCLASPWESRNFLAASLADFDHYVAAISKTIKNATHVIAWSLGGLVAIRLANCFPESIKKTVFIASTARFVQQDIAIDPVWFQQFRRDYNTRPESVLNKFLTLQVSGDEFAKSTLRQLRKISSLEEYDLDECGYGLSMLEELDLTTELTNLSCKSVFIHGECDAVLPLSAGRHAAELCNAEFCVISSAGHAPHVSHSQEVASFITNYLDK